MRAHREGAVNDSDREPSYGVQMVESIRRMFGELDAFLSARPFNRLLIVHGYEVEDIAVTRMTNPFARSLTEERAVVTLRMPVVWEVEPRSFPLRASDTPVTDEPDRMREMLQNYVDAGGLGAADIVSWDLSRDPDEVPSKRNATNAAWTLQAVIEAV